MSESQTSQQTLTGEQTEERFTKPKTLLWCETCEKILLRSGRWDHEHDDLAEFEEFRKKELKEKVPEEARVETQTWEVTFYYEMRETVRVEADSKHDAKEAAEREQTYRGEVTQTLHTEETTWGEQSAATIEWLENRSLLPEDHGVTREDIAQVLEYE